MQNIIIDTKHNFNVENGIKSFGDIIYLEYENFKFGFCGFIKIGEKLGEVPILLSIDNKNKSVDIFSYINNNKKLRAINTYIHDRLIKKGYKINPIRMELEGYYVCKIKK